MKYDGHIKVLKSLLYEEKYADLSLKAVICIALLYDRFKLSMLTGYVDKNGKICIIFPQEKLMRPLRCCEKTVGKILQELEDNDLVERHSQGLTKPDIIYITEKTCKIFSSENDKLTGQDGKKLHTNNIYNNNNNKNMDKDQLFILLNEKWNFREIASMSEYHQEIIGIVFDVVIDLLSSDDKEIYIAGKMRRLKEVNHIISELTSFHIIKIIDRIIEHIDEIDNLRLYVITSLYNSGKKIPVKKS